MIARCKPRTARRIRTGRPQPVLAMRMAIAAVLMPSVVLGVTIAAVAYTMDDHHAGSAAAPQSE